MPNKPGNDAATSEARAGEELVRFNATMSLDELAVTRMRMQQAIRRDPSLKDLLQPGIEEVERVMVWQREIVVKGNVE